MKNPVLCLNNREINIFQSNVLVIPQTNCLQHATFMYFRSEVISNPQIVVLHHHEDSSIVIFNIPFAQTMITLS